MKGRYIGKAIKYLKDITLKKWCVSFQGYRVTKVVLVGVNSRAWHRLVAQKVLNFAAYAYKCRT
jgi:hypothetical protein